MSYSTYEYSHKKDKRAFEVLIYEQDYRELCSWVLRHRNIETGGDLFGLWSDDRSAVIQLALGPGKGCRRTGTSFFQDIRYLESVGSYLTGSEGLCHIGEWHSHHQLGLARPSGGDENTVWNNMPKYGLDRFVIFIANIERSRKSTATVNIGCFLFEYERQRNTAKRSKLPVLPGRFTILQGENPFGRKEKIRTMMLEGAEPPRMTVKETKYFQIENTNHESRNVVGVWTNSEPVQPEPTRKRKKADSGAGKATKAKGYRLLAAAEESRSSSPDSTTYKPDRLEEVVANEPTANSLGSNEEEKEGGNAGICGFIHKYLCANCWYN